MAPSTILKIEGPQKHVVGDRNLYLPLLSRLRGKMREKFFERFGEHASEKTYIGHGDFTEINGWTFGGRFFPVDPTETDLS
jgi:hypothetical protein